MLRVEEKEIRQITWTTERGKWSVLMRVKVRSPRVQVVAERGVRPHRGWQ